MPSFSETNLAAFSLRRISFEFLPMLLSCKSIAFRFPSGSIMNVALTESPSPSSRVSNWEQIRTGNTKHGYWVGKNFCWTVPKDTVLVFDECHRAKGRDTKNARMLVAAKRQGIKIMLLSATMATNPLEMWAIGYALGLHRLTNFWDWARMHGCRKNVNWGGMYFPQRSAPRFLRKIHAELADKCVRICTKDIPDYALVMGNPGKIKGWMSRQHGW